MPRLRLALEWLIIATLAAMVAVGVAMTPGGQQLSNWLFDQELAWSERDASPQILIAQIDEQSLGTVGRWPWPRRVHASVVDRLTDAGVAAIGYDVLFTEPDTIADDTALALAIARSRRVAVPAYALFPGTNGKAYDVQMPIEDIARVARSIGHVNVLFDSDGQVRRARMQSAIKPQQMPHLMQVLARDVLQSDPALPDELVIPFNRVGAFSAIPVDKILNGEVPPALLKDRIVLVGATAQGLGDLLPVSGPVGSVMPGVEVQANILNAIMNKTWIRDAGARQSALIGTIMVLFVMASYWRLTPNLGLAITLGTGLLAVVATAIGLALFQIWLTPLPFLLALLFAYPMWNWRRLSALNSFVEHETRALNEDLGGTDRSGPGFVGLDSIALAATRLRSVIGELRDRRSFLRNVIESAPDALCVVGPDGQVVMANEHAKHIFGEDVEGTPIQTLLTKISVGDASQGDEITLSDGRTMLTKFSSLNADDGKGVGSIVRLADISERRNSERERDETLEFLSHDMRAPAVGIMTVLETAAPPENMLPVVERIRNYARNSLKLADDFVQLARLTSLSPEHELIDLKGVFEEAIDGSFDMARKKNVVVPLDAPDDLPPILGDSWLLTRAIGNLLDNAVKYSPLGEIVSCKIEVTPKHDASPTTICCSVSDRGPGIPAERMAALFARFGARDVSVGLSAGLGLAFVKKSVELLNGQITCDTSEVGTIFSLTFTAAKPDPNLDLL